MTLILTLDHTATAKVPEGTYAPPPPKITWKDRQETTEIIIHDSHTQPDVEDIQDYLKATGQKMGLMDIGYHSMILRDGSEVITREFSKIGSHTPGRNMKSVGLCLIGGMGAVGPENNFTYPQRLSLVRRIAWLMHQYPNAKLVAHSEVQSFVHRTQPCPCLDMEILRDDIEHFIKFGVIP